MPCTRCCRIRAPRWTGSLCLTSWTPIDERRPAEARLRAQHAHCRPLRPVRQTRRADHGAARLRIHRPYVLKGVQRGRRTRRHEPSRGKLLSRPANTWNIHLQTHDDLLLVVNAKDMFAEFADKKAYYKGQPGKVLGTATAERKSTQRDWTVGLAVYDISKPDAPRRIGFMAVDGGGIHRLWYGRALCLRVGPCRRLHRLHLHDGGHERSSQSARSRALVNSRHEPGRWRDAVMAGDQPVRPASCDRARRHRLRRLARRRAETGAHGRPPPCRAHVIQSADVCVDAASLIYSTDYMADCTLLNLVPAQPSFLPRTPFLRWRLPAVGDDDNPARAACRTRV